MPVSVQTNCQVVTPEKDAPFTSRIVFAFIPQFSAFGGYDSTAYFFTRNWFAGGGGVGFGVGAGVGTGTTSITSW